MNLKSLKQNCQPALLAILIVAALAGLTWHYAARLMADANSRSVFSLDFPRLYSQALIFKLSDLSFSILPLNASAAEAKISGNTVKYIDAFASTDVVQTRSASKLKEDIILKKPGHPAEFAYQVDLSQLDFSYGQNGDLQFFKKGQAADKNASPLFIIPAPFMVDAGGKKSATTDVAVSLNAEGKLLLTPGAAWLKTAKYPVTLDPSVEINVLTLHSHPQQGDSWEVEFTTLGRADLKIIPNDQATIDDDVFTGLYCGANKLNPQILSGDVIYYPDWQCAQTAKVTHYTRKAGQHTLRFEYGAPGNDVKTAYAYNSSAPYVDDVFSTYTYTGTGAAQTINNGIDLAGNGGMVWGKSRSNTYDNFLVDSARDSHNLLYSNNTYYQQHDANCVSGFTSSGFSLGVGGAVSSNTNNATYVSWTFRKAPRFFDVVTYTGDGTSYRNIAHSLTTPVGLVIVKRTDSTGDWFVAWNGNNSTTLRLNSTAATVNDSALKSGSDGSGVFIVGGSTELGANTNGATYVAYLFAHDTASDGIIQAGSFTTDGSGNTTSDVNLGWEPQYVLAKRSDATGDWKVFDIMRGMPADNGAGVGAKLLAPNTSAAEASTAGWMPTASGFKLVGGAGGGAYTYIYLAIRRPNKPPTSGTQVYNAIARTGTGAAATVTGVGFAPDLLISRRKPSVTSPYMMDRLRGSLTHFYTDATNAEVSSSDSVLEFNNDGMKVGVDGTYGNVNNTTGGSNNYVHWFFRRAPGVFDTVAYTGTGSGSQTINHNLGVAPELTINKSRSARGWTVYYNNSIFLRLNETNAGASETALNPTATTFTASLGAGFGMNAAENYITYLFATKAGVSKVGSYTGNGGNQAINAGFSNGAKFVLIKRTDSTGDWYVWDSTRGFSAGAEPRLSLNTSAAEVATDDSVDVVSSGFVVNQNTATNVNAANGTYIYLAFADAPATAPNVSIFRAGGIPSAPAGYSYVDDVFSAYTYTGTGAAQTINNGIDLAGKGGMVWIKRRGNGAHHGIQDTVQGITQYISTSLTTAASTNSSGQGITAFNSNGFSIGTNSFDINNVDNYASWTFRKAPRFFDVVTWTGDGTENKRISHSLGQAPGMIIIKNRTGDADNWYVYHRSACSVFSGASPILYLNQTGAAAPSGWASFGTAAPTASDFGVGTGTTNSASKTYVAYLFAHDTAADGIIKAGSFTTNASGDATVNLGWEPQWFLVKNYNNAEADGDWRVYDSARGFFVDSGSLQLKPNTSDAEGINQVVGPLSTGVNFNGPVAFANTGFIYLAIRRPNKPSKEGGRVYNAIARTGTDAPFTISGVGFPPDMILYSNRDAAITPITYPVDRLRGIGRKLSTSSTAAESEGSPSTTSSFTMDGCYISDSWLNWGAATGIYWHFRRAPGVFDVVAYTGSSASSGAESLQTLTHNLGAKPELVIFKSRSNATDGQWLTTYNFTSTAHTVMYLNAQTSASNLSYTTYTIIGEDPTSSQIRVGNMSTPAYSNNLNSSGTTYVAYLFATKPGISKVGSYTGNGSSQTINAGFSSGAKFVLIKRTDSTGDWYVWDSTRGIVAGNDPHLSLNTTAAEVTNDDSIDPANAGFIVNQVAATNINVNAATYIYLAFSGDPNNPSTSKPVVFRAGGASVSNCGGSGSTVASGGTITYTDLNGLNPRSSSPYSVGYIVHTFTSGGTFTPASSGNVEYLVVAGGGGGGSTHSNDGGGGGGGAGGLLTATGYSVTAGNSLTVTIGGGGAGSTSQDAKGSNGSDSSFGTITATGGGGGASAGACTGANGGSGGGGDGNCSSAGGTAVSGGAQGNNGGSSSGKNSGAGGGGKGSVGGTDADIDIGGNGGSGYASSISGSSVTYAGGGGGGAYTSGHSGGTATGGGGHGGDGSASGENTNISAGTANTGGGGGGAGGASVGGTGQINGTNGGSGIVIVRYSYIPRTCPIIFR